MRIDAFNFWRSPYHPQKHVNFHAQPVRAEYGHLPSHENFTVVVTVGLTPKDVEGKRHMRFVLNGPGVVKTLDRHEFFFGSGSHDFKIDVTVPFLSPGLHTITCLIEEEKISESLQVMIEHDPSKDREPKV